MKSTSHNVCLFGNLRSNNFWHSLFHAAPLPQCADIHQILQKFKTYQQFCKSLYTCWSTTCNVMLPKKAHASNASISTDASPEALAPLAQANLFVGDPWPPDPLDQYPLASWGVFCNDQLPSIAWESWLRLSLQAGPSVTRSETREENRLEYHSRFSS